MKIQNLAIVILTSIATLFAACTSSTVIRSNVPNTKVFLNGAYVGNAPYVMADTKIVGSSTSVRLEAPGHTPTMAVITRNEEFSVSACIGGVFLLIPFLWIMDYKAEHLYQLQQGQPAQYPEA